VRVRITRRAAEHISQAAEWWRRNRPLAPQALHEELREAFSLLAAQPGIGAAALNAKTKGVRRVLLARVHYHLYYRVHGDELQVLALWHTRRGTGPQI
jgi:plasmid stabilization system protein ParE